MAGAVTARAQSPIWSEASPRSSRSVIRLLDSQNRQRVVMPISLTLASERREQWGQVVMNWVIRDILVRLLTFLVRQLSDSLEKDLNQI